IARVKDRVVQGGHNVPIRILSVDSSEVQRSSLNSIVYWLTNGCYSIMSSPNQNLLPENKMLI
ncbi:MAG: hypothetical protein KJ687_08530, partial [Proteobacteria bacterium]|nr:hypothetical protein [Pseudomonadota bacterium]